MSWTHMSNIVENTFLNILILRIVDVRVSCFSFSIDSINNPISIDSGSEGSPDRETP